MVERKRTCSVPSPSAPTTRKCHLGERWTRSLCAIRLHNKDTSPHARALFDRGVEKLPLTPMIVSLNEHEYIEFVSADRHRDWQNTPLLKQFRSALQVGISPCMSTPKLDRVLHVVRQ